MKTLSILFLIIFLSLSRHTFSQIKSVDINALVTMMAGSFSSEDQSKNDPEYSDFRLHVKKIWPDRTDGKWLYLEKTDANTPDKPCMLRVYRITSTREGRFESAVFTINNSLSLTEEWLKENPLSGLTPDSLNLIEGCSVIFTLMNDTTFEGSSVGNNCKSDLHGASYIKSKVVVSTFGITSWDRGFDENGKYIWGPENGGYIFKRIKE